MNLFKISTCALCLGTVLGVSSSMAMEQNGEKCQQEVSGQVQILETSRKKEEKSERYLKFYNDLITKGKLKETDARKQAEIFEKELTKGKGFIYSQYYSMLRVVRKLDSQKATLQAELFEREFKINRNFKKADYYATVMISCNIRAVKFAKFEEKIRSCGESKETIKEMLKVARKGFKSGKSCFCVRKHVRQSKILENELKDGKSYDYARIYVSLRLNKQSEENARRGAEIFELEKESLKHKEYDDDFHDLYVQFYLIVRTDWGEPKDVAEKIAHIIIEEIKSGRSQLYARVYARRIVLNGEKESIARKKTYVIEEERKRGEGEYFAEVYADAIVDFGVNREEAREMTHVAIKEIKLGRPRLYALLYSQFIVVDKGSEEFARKVADIIYNEMENGKCYSYALKYAELIINETPEDKARIQTEAFVKAARSRKRYYYASRYSELIADGKPEEEAMREAEKYDKEMEEKKMDIT